jgi:hypothetical protein
MGHRSSAQNKGSPWRTLTVKDVVKVAVRHAGRPLQILQLSIRFALSKQILYIVNHTIRLQECPDCSSPHGLKLPCPLKGGDIW